ncbi:MAG: NAD-binding protein [Nocardioidaceae bacterium]|nr:NAD-binding protein [Nocardioidaceae bacterium]
MTFLVVMRRMTHVRTWALPAIMITVVFVTSWPLMALAEPAANQITDPANYWWWFVVTAATVGYGDFFPLTWGGHLVGAYVIGGGIITLTTLFTVVAEKISNAKGRRMKGLDDLDLSGHVAVLGYTPGRTERIVHELSAEGDTQVVLCAWDDLAEHPMPSLANVSFVRGELTDEDVLRRACVDRAGRVLVDARDDNEALSVTVAAMHVNPEVHTVVTLRDMARAKNLGYVDSDVRCVQWHSPRMVTEELQDPGISRVYADLMTHGGANTYSVRLLASLDGTSFGDYQQALGSTFGSTVLAARCGGEIVVSPPWDTALPGDSVLYYIADRRLSPDDVSRAVNAVRQA